MIYLASQSPRRKQLMELTDLEFTVCPSNVSESGVSEESPQKTVEYLSLIKARALFDTVKKDDIIIGADTVVALDGIIFGKPHDEAEAFSMLKMLSGKIHSVYTGVTLIKKDEKKSEITFSEETKVDFYELCDDEIKSYIKTEKPFDKAGAYGIQEKGSLFVKAIHGDFFNVVGLPLSHTYREIKKLL